MTKNNTKTARNIATAMVGASCYHRGEHGEIVGADVTSYDVPMLRVRFGERTALLTVAELGSK